MKKAMRMNQLRLWLLAAAIWMGWAAASAGEVTVKVANPTAWQRCELVEVDADSLYSRLGLAYGSKIVVTNALGQNVDHQLTHDRKLVFEAAALPHGEAKFSVAQGTPPPPTYYVHGQQYAYRKDDMAWENDRTGYRVYGPKFQRDGDVGYGIDVWLKRTPELVLPRFYIDNCFNHQSFHLDHGLGLDCYNVGASLGCGTPALLDGGKIIYPYCYESYKILDNGPLRFTLQLNFAPVACKYGSKVVEHRLITLDKGSNYCRMDVCYDGLEKPAEVAAGIVLHSTDAADRIVGSDYAIYADPTGQPAKHNFQIFVGMAFPEGNVEMAAREVPMGKDGIAGHLLAMRRGLGSGQHFTYLFGSAWSKNDVRTLDEWQLRTRHELDNVSAKLSVSLL